ncbi:hypothetical protein RF55_19591 [Lasius niger]|uniref:L,D-TPase catalytic domain-containing protein n=1 Tax=Lasius niger TaxID=67767 RepID=A0A0J7JZJ7_LASNI|nr:hypothetical protein RF55_19591 [Lasius niger]
MMVKALHQYHGLVPLSVVRTARSGASDWFGSHGCVRLAEADAKVMYGWADAISILEDEVMSVTFRTDKMTFAAQRSTIGTDQDDNTAPRLTQ